MSISVLQATNTNNPAGFPSGGFIGATQCGSMLIVGVILSAAYGVDPGTVTSMVTNKGDILTNITGWFGPVLTGPFPPPYGPGDPQTSSVISSVWACLHAQSGTTGIAVTTSGVTNADYSFAEVKSTLGGFAVDDSGGLTSTSGYPIDGPSLTGTGNDIFFSTLGAGSLNLSGLTVGWSVIDYNAGFYLIGTGAQQIQGTNPVSHVDSYATAGAAFKEVAVSFPDIAATPSSLSFSGSGSQNVSVSNVGVGTLDFTASGSPSWVTASPSSGTAPATIAVAVNLSSANFLQNGDFESGTLADWTVSEPLGGTAPAATAAQSHGGTYSCVLGSQSLLSEVDGTYAIYQLIDLAAGAHLSFWYLPKSDFNADDDAQQCVITTADGLTVLDTVLDTWDDEVTWQHVTRDLSFLGEQTVRLYFKVRNDTGGGSDPGFTYMYVDDITISPTAVLKITGADCSTGHSPTLIPLSISAPAVSVTPNSLKYVSHEWAFSPAVGDGVGNDGTAYAQTLNITASGAWTLSSDEPWVVFGPLQTATLSGSGNATVSVSIQDKNPATGQGFFPASPYPQFAFQNGTYTATVTLTDGMTTVTIPVTFIQGLV